MNTSPQSPPPSNELDEILEEYENGQNPQQSEEYRLNKAKSALNAYILAEVLGIVDKCFEDNQGYIDEKLKDALIVRFVGKS